MKDKLLKYTGMARYAYPGAAILQLIVATVSSSMIWDLKDRGWEIGEVYKLSRTLHMSFSLLPIIVLFILFIGLMKNLEKKTGATIGMIAKAMSILLTLVSIVITLSLGAEEIGTSNALITLINYPSSIVIYVLSMIALFMVFKSKDNKAINICVYLYAILITIPTVWNLIGPKIQMMILESGNTERIESFSNTITTILTITNFARIITLTAILFIFHALCKRNAR